jgi:hypothetical protein
VLGQQVAQGPALDLLLDMAALGLDPVLAHGDPPSARNGCSLASIGSPTKQVKGQTP